MHVPPIIDVEASGFGSASYPIEVGIALPDGQAFCSLIRPAEGWRHWDAGAEAIHKVPREVLLQRGRPVVEVAWEINERLRGATVYCDSWYHDFTWLSRLFDAADSAPAFRLEDLRTLLKQEEADAWHVTKTLVQQEMKLDRHRASNDARVLQMTLMRIKGLPMLAML